MDASLTTQAGEASALKTTLAVPPAELHLDLPFHFPSASDCMEPLEEVAGQERAREALQFGLEVSGEGYNIAVSGVPESGRTTMARLHVTAAAAHRPKPSDWCYLHNFEEPRRPRAVALPPGAGDQLAHTLTEFVRVCREDLPRAFDTEGYAAKVQETLEPFTTERDRLLSALDAQARAAGLLLNNTPLGLVAIPARPDGTPMSPVEFNALDAATRERIERAIVQQGEAIESTMRTIRHIEAQARTAVSAVDKEITRFVLGPILGELRAKFPGAELEQHFAALEADVVSNLGVFRQFTDGFAETQPSPMVSQVSMVREALLRRYGVNLFVRQDTSTAGAPVQEERHPTFANLFGRMEFEHQMGTMVTDFLHLRAGALHRANGGFLILKLQDVLSDVRSWPTLKLALKNREVRLAEAGQGFFPFPITDLIPEGIPLDVKVVLIGDPGLFALLDAFDDEFASLFKVRAALEPDIDLDAGSVEGYGRFICRTQKDLALPAFDRSALEEVTRFGARLAGRRDRLSARYGNVADLCREAAHIATASHADVVTADHVGAALRGRSRRSSLVADRLRRLVREGTLRVRTSGTEVGQVNGLAVYLTGNYAFGTPARITCRVGAGRLGVVAIERETERSGAIHTKGVLVLSGYLAGMFGRQVPLAFNASLTFEQSYDEVEGDSASSAELYAILTALAELPVAQGIAATGSVDQFGNIQAVGGVPEKIEGFFDLCNEVGLDGTQGVIIPEANKRNLTLRPDVVRAVEEGKFHIWAISRVEEGIELLTGVPAGARDALGHFPSGSVFARVERELARLRSLAEPPSNQKLEA